MLSLLALYFPACHAAPELPVSETVDLQAVRDRITEGSYAEAVELATTYLRNHPRSAEGHYLRGRARYIGYVRSFERNSHSPQQGPELSRELSRASADFTRAIELQPTFAEAYDYRGICSAALGRHSAAMADYNKALELKPSLVPTYYGRAYLFEQLNEPNRAVEDYRRFLEHSSDEYWRSRAKMRLRKLEGALVPAPPRPPAQVKKLTTRKKATARKKAPARKAAGKKATSKKATSKRATEAVRRKQSAPPTFRQAPPRRLQKASQAKSGSTKTQK